MGAVPGRRKIHHAELLPGARVMHWRRVAHPVVHAAGEVLGGVDRGGSVEPQGEVEGVRPDARLVPPAAGHEVHLLRVAPHDRPAVRPQDARAGIGDGDHEIPSSAAARSSASRCRTAALSGLDSHAARVSPSLASSAPVTSGEMWQADRFQLDAISVRTPPGAASAPRLSLIARTFRSQAWVTEERRLRNSARVLMEPTSSASPTRPPWMKTSTPEYPPAAPRGERAEGPERRRVRPEPQP